MNSEKSWFILADQTILELAGKVIGQHMYK